MAKLVQVTRVINFQFGVFSCVLIVHILKTDFKIIENDWKPGLLLLFLGELIIAISES